MSGVYTVVGVSHQSAPVAIRESLAQSSSEGGRLNTVVAQACGISDVVVLSTCSRFEIYAEMDTDGLKRLLAWFEERAARPLKDYIYIHKDRETMAHLFRVAGGLDSWVIGETEILGQMKAAYRGSCTEKRAGRSSHLAFQRALNVGKRIRNETRIVGGIASIGGAASVMARRIFNDLKEKNILVFGAGAMAESTVRHLCAKGVSGVWVSNRSINNAKELASQLRGEACTLAEGMAKLAEADIAVFSTGAPDYLLDGDQAKKVAALRGGKPLFIIDIALPRNVDPAAAEASSFYLYDLDDLKRIVKESMARRSEDTLKAEEIVAVESLDLWQRITAPPRPRPEVARPRPSRRPKFAGQTPVPA